MDPLAYVQQLRLHGERLADAASRAGLDALVPTCPRWLVRDLVMHTSQVHRWATTYVVSARTAPPGDGDALAEAPADPHLLEWLGEGYRRLASALQEAPDDLACWSFLPAPTPRAFWARRQAHETAIHAADAAAANGEEALIDALFAVDGIEELLFGFFARPGGRLVADPPARLALGAADTGDAWTITVGTDSRITTRAAAPDADCVVTGSAADLYLLLWNRGDAARCAVDGDPSVLRLWRERAQVRWA